MEACEELASWQDHTQDFPGSRPTRTTGTLARTRIAAGIPTRTTRTAGTLARTDGSASEFMEFPMNSKAARMTVGSLWEVLGSP